MIKKSFSLFSFFTATLSYFSIIQVYALIFQVPQVFVCGQWLGGCSDLRRLAASGELTKMVEKCCDGDLSCAGLNSRAGNRNRIKTDIQWANIVLFLQPKRGKKKCSLTFSIYENRLRMAQKKRNQGTLIKWSDFFSRFSLHKQKIYYRAQPSYIDVIIFSEA